MKHLRTIMACFALCVVVIAAASCAKKADKDPTSEALSAAESWLAIVDRGDYETSWDQSAELFRNAVTRDGWGQSLVMARQPLGALVSRTMKSADFATTLPGAPDGEYVVIQFTTSFANKESAVETVTPMKDPDGTWRVSGYFIR